MTRTKTIATVNIGDEETPIIKYELSERLEHEDGRVDITSHGFITAESVQDKIDQAVAQKADWEDTLSTLNDLISEGEE